MSRLNSVMFVWLDVEQSLQRRTDTLDELLARSLDGAAA